MIPEIYKFEIMAMSTWFTVIAMKDEYYITEDGREIHHSYVYKTRHHSRYVKRDEEIYCEI